MQKSLPELRKKCAFDILSRYKKANAGHIGASLSCLELLIDANSRMNENDYIILSKGHAACALYVTLAEFGRLESDMLDSYYKDGTLLAAHPPCSGEIKSIPFGTGSLGHGLSLATGLVFSQKYSKKDFKVYTVLSEGDCNEGSTWEAALFAAQHNLSNLYVIVDANGLQGFGNSNDILNLEPLVDKWKSFGLDVVCAENGNDFESIEKSYFELHKNYSNKPKCIIARTTKGHGVSYMENKMEWHYLPMSDDQFNVAISELDNIK